MRCSNHYLSICNCIYIYIRIYIYIYTHDDLGNALDSIHYLQRMKVPSPAALSLSPGSMIDSWAELRGALLGTELHSVPFASIYPQIPYYNCSVRRKVDF